MQYVCKYIAYVAGQQLCSPVGACKQTRSSPRCLPDTGQNRWCEATSPDYFVRLSVQNVSPKYQYMYLIYNVCVNTRTYIGFIQCALQSEAK